MPLSNPHTLVTKQYRHTFYGNAGKKKLNCECVAEPMGMPVSDICEFEKSGQASPPAAYCDLYLLSTIPKEMRLSDLWRLSQCMEEALRQNCVYRHSCLLRVEEKSFPFNLVDAQPGTALAARRLCTRSKTCGGAVVTIKVEVFLPLLYVRMVLLRAHYPL